MLYYICRSIVIFLSFYYSVFTCFYSSAESFTTLKITGIGQNGIIGSAYLKTAKDFENKFPNVNVKIQLQSDRAFKENLDYTLSGKSNFDIVILHGGTRLTNAIKNKKLLPITDVWTQGNLKENFTTPMQDIVTYQNEIYAVPFSYYLWGFYYKKSFFESLKLSPPTKWFEFLETLKILESKDLNPIFIGTKNPWPIGNWFEYLNLRLNGLDFHYRFVNGNINANSKEIAQVLSYLKELIDADYFNKSHKNKTLTGGLPLLLRNKVGMVLAGGAYENFLPDSMKDDIGFFPFPKINENIPTIQVSPVDVMTISANSKNPELAKKFITFMADQQVQTKHNLATYQLPVNIHSKTSSLGTSKASMDILKDADGLTLFFDREVEKEFGLKNLAIWKEFLDVSDIKQTQIQMERARLAYLQRKCKKSTCTNELDLKQ